MHLEKQETSYQVIRYHYKAKKKGHKKPSVQGVGYGETLKRFYAFLYEMGYSFEIICIEQQSIVDISEVPKMYREVVKRPKFL